VTDDDEILATLPIATASATGVHPFEVDVSGDGIIIDGERDHHWIEAVLSVAACSSVDARSDLEDLQSRKALAALARKKGMASAHFTKVVQQSTALVWFANACGRTGQPIIKKEHGDKILPDSLQRPGAIGKLYIAGAASANRPAEVPLVT
jgi:hypothetical protein